MPKTNHIHNGILFNAKPSREVFGCMCFVEAPKTSDDLVIQYGFPVRTTSCMTTLLNFIIHIVIMCSKPEMAWVYATRVIAFVKDLKAVRYRAATEHPSHPMRGCCFSKLDFAIAFPGPFVPKPTCVWTTGLIYSFPEAFFNWSRKTFIVTSAAARWRSLGILYARWFCLEEFSAGGTFKLHRNSFCFNSGDARPAASTARSYLFDDGIVFQAVGL